MSNWVESLINVYKRNQMNEDLMPKYHADKTADITVYLSAEGDFKKAEPVPKKNNHIIAPQTAESAVRTNNKAPAPLFDQWSYLDQTYVSYTTGERTKVEIERFQQAAQEYLTNLFAWCESEFSHPKIRAIHRYLSENSLLKDVQTYDPKLLKYVNCKKKDKTGTVVKTWLELKNLFVRFVVSGDTPGVNPDDPDECWKNRQIRTCWQSYRKAMERDTDQALIMDYLTGEYQPEAVSCPQKLILGNGWSKAKLISSNDDRGLTYLGRFRDNSEAFRIGADSSIMLHDALHMVFQKQGRIYGDLAVVAWTDDDSKVPDFNADTNGLLLGRTIDQKKDNSDGEKDDSGDTLLDDDDDENMELAEAAVKTAAKEENQSAGNDNQDDEVTAKTFLDFMNGGVIPEEKTFESLHVMMFTAPSEGALAVADYQELSCAEYYKNLRRWHTEGVGKWRQFGARYVAMPSLYQIATLLYGRECKRGENTVMAFNSKDSASVARAYRELIPCVWYGKRIPLSVVRTAVERASDPMRFKEKKNWYRVLSLACILVRKYRIQYKNEGEWRMDDHNISMTKEEKKEARAIAQHDRDYKFGAFMAIADQIELEARVRSGKTDVRCTQAFRSLSDVMKRPWTAWGDMFADVQKNYLCKLPAERQKFYMDQMAYVGLAEEDITRRAKLDGRYFIGYSKKRAELLMKAKEQKAKEQSDKAVAKPGDAPNACA